MAKVNNKNPNQKQPGEKQPGTFHFNPGNMSGKTAVSREDKTGQRSNSDSPRERQHQQKQKS